MSRIPEKDRFELFRRGTLKYDFARATQATFANLQKSAARSFVIGVPVIFLFLLGCGPFRTRKLEPVKQAVETKSKATLASIKNLIPHKEASNDRLWRPDLAILPYVEFQGNDVTIRNIRDCRYRTETDYDVRHYDLTFALDDVKTVDFIIVPFQNAPIIAHTMLSFGLADGQYFVISAEARFEQGETYSQAGGTQNKFELIYLIGSERDLIPLRTEVRKADVYIYRANAQPDQVQDLLVDMLARVNKLSREPEFYNTITNNCTTNIVRHINHLKPGKIPLDPRVLLPGHSDKLAFELGLIESNGNFEDLKARSYVNRLSHLYYDDPEFSKKIRQH